MKLTNLYVAAADKLRSKGLVSSSREITLSMCLSELGLLAPTGERALLEKYLTHIDKKIDRFDRPAYRLSPAMRIAAQRAEREQVVLMGVGGW
jgi:hypothetical protein